MFALAIVGLRLAYGLSASAIDVPWAPGLSWRYGRGNGLAIIGLTVLPMVVGAIAMVTTHFFSIVILSSLLSEGWREPGGKTVLFLTMTIVNYFQAAVVGAGMAAIFRSITGFRPGAPLRAPT